MHAIVRVGAECCRKLREERPQLAGVGQGLNPALERIDISLVGGGITQRFSAGRNQISARDHSASSAGVRRRARHVAGFISDRVSSCENLLH